MPPGQMCGHGLLRVVCDLCVRRTKAKNPCANTQKDLVEGMAGLEPDDFPSNYSERFDSESIPGQLTQAELDARDLWGYRISGFYR